MCTVERGWRWTSGTGCRPKPFDPETIYLNPIKSINIFSSILIHYLVDNQCKLFYSKPFSFHRHSDNLKRFKINQYQTSNILYRRIRIIVNFRYFPSDFCVKPHQTCKNAFRLTHLFTRLFDLFCNYYRFSAIVISIQTGRMIHVIRVKQLV